MLSIISAPATMCWAIVEQDFGGSCQLHLVELSASYDGQEAIDKIKSHIDTCSASYTINRIFQKVMTKRVAGTARIDQAVTDSSNSSSRMRVYIEDFQPSLFLTKTLENPSFLHDEFTFMSRNMRFWLRPGFRHLGSLAGQEVIVISRALAKVRIAALLIFSSFLSIAIGVCVGVASHQADAGVTVGVGVFAFAALLQGLAAWFEQ